MKWNHPDQLFVSVITKLAYHWALVRPCWLNTWARKSLYVCVHSGVKELGFYCLVTKSCPTFLQPHRLVCQRRQLHPTPVLLPGKSHGQRSLVGCSPWGLEDWDTTERLHFHFSLSCIREEMATHSSDLAWRIPETVEPGGLPSTGSHRVRHDWSDLAAATAADQSARVLCPLNSPGKNTRVGCHSFSRGYSRPRDWTHILCIAGRFSTTEPPEKPRS